jgi:hypothetical protein
VTTMVEARWLLHGGGGINNVPSNENFVQNSSNRHYRSCPRYVCGDEVGRQGSQDCPFLSLALRGCCHTCARGGSSASSSSRVDSGCECTVVEATSMPNGDGGDGSGGGGGGVDGLMPMAEEEEKAATSQGSRVIPGLHGSAHEAVRRRVRAQRLPPSGIASQARIWGYLNNIAAG